LVEYARFGGRTNTLADTSLTSGGYFFGMYRQANAALSNIQQAEIHGGGNNEVIDARGFSGPTTLYGGGGVPEYGIPGGTIYGGKGNDTIVTAPGGYAVFDILGQNTFQSQPGDEVFGLVNRCLTDSELSQTGSLTVSLQGNSLVF